MGPVDEMRSVDVPAWMFAVWLGMAAVSAGVYAALAFGLGLPDALAKVLAALPMLAVTVWGLGYKKRRDSSRE